MWSSAIPKSLSISKIIGGISKTLQVANQIIPIYQKAIPMINNARSAFSIVKELKKPTPNKNDNKEKKVKINNQSNAYQLKKESITSPTFFL